MAGCSPSILFCCHFRGLGCMSLKDTVCTSNRCHALKIKCSGRQSCSRCRQTECGESCQYAVRDKKLKVQESYIDEILSENSQLNEILRALSTPQVSPSASVQASVPSSDAYPSYTPESSLLEGATQWPGLAQARLLIGTAFNQLSRVYHLVLRKFTLEQPESVYRIPTLRDDPAIICKFFGLFALGGIYSSRPNASPTSRVPGTSYHARAMSPIPIMPERPGLVHSLFSYFLNRRYLGYVLIGSAMRLGLILGLNHNIPAQQCVNPIKRENRVRLWWAIYVFDRMFTSKIGFPLQIRNEDIHVDLPTEIADPTAQEQFSDSANLVGTIRSSRIIGQTVDKIYGRKHHAEPFLQREQRLLLALQDWLQSLPVHVRLRPDDSAPPKHIFSLHLQFNQCVILATRPILLHALFQSGHREDAEDLPQPVITISDACTHAARHSHSLIIEEWVNGSLPMHGYFYTQYLFSSCIALVISGLLPSLGNPADLEALETATEILHRMGDHGNLAAAEFYENIKRVKQALPADLTDMHEGQEPRSHTPWLSIPSALTTAADTELETHNAGILSASNSATEMAFLEPTMQDFLGTSDYNMDLINPSDLLVEGTDNINLWPGILWTS
ncbi:Zn(II)2Cys6 transcription factor [Aspergillus homomorphus CBS 101889]|uniref:Fungal-specific transcription factor n=1 Tax=Aspergillus homomorphus (strain CBS 101889) TaxID=1450537 RepID=A0A395I371_ASPHC|nr:fungal-specific transcription factor [Aspergillus homomorphus CBS 101889]RAL12954.1 fungal-specific transcription factor [Aspergillus homomorphus CBS 101889]